jgi:hypothetical protein
MHHEEECEAYCTTWCGHPSRSELLESLKDLWLQALQNHVVRPLDLSIRLWVGNNRPVHTDVIVIAEVEEFRPRELGAIVGDDHVGYAEEVNDVSE